MAHYHWQKKLDTGIDDFDRDHQKIMAYANSIFDAVNYNDRKKLGETLDLLLKYTDSVFVYEDSLMEQSSYPYAEHHKAVHRNFTQKITDYRIRHIAGADISRQLLSDLKIWITNHVYRDDSDYVPYVRKRYAANWFTKLLGKCA